MDSNLNLNLQQQGFQEEEIFKKLGESAIYLEKISKKKIECEDKLESLIAKKTELNSKLMEILQKIHDVTEKTDNLIKQGLVVNTNAMNSKINEVSKIAFKNKIIF